MLSMTDPDDLQVKPCQGDGVLAEGAGILFGVNKNTLENILVDAFWR